MEIKEYDYNSRKEYIETVRKYNNSKELSILNRLTFINKGKKVFLVIRKGFFKKYKIIAYAIIDEELEIINLVNNIDKKYIGDEKTIYITDFMVRSWNRQEGIGKELAKYIINYRYKNKNIILQPDGDGYWFWKNFGFINDNTSKNTWILERD